MKPLLFIVALLSASVLHAQCFSAGVRSGAGFWKGQAWDREQYAFSDKRTTVWEKEAFVRYESAKHLAWELGINEVQGSADGVMYGLCGVGLPETYTTGSRITDKNYGLNMRLQYGIDCRHVKGLRNYAGIALTPTLRILESRDILFHSTTGSYSDGSTTTKKGIETQLGVEDMIRYRLGRHLDIHSLIGYKFNAGGTLLQHALAVQAGVAYVF